MNGRGRIFCRHQPWVRTSLFLVVAVGIFGVVIYFWDRNSTTDFAITAEAPFSEHIYTPEYAKIVALTFDDGPSRLVTPRVLEILREKNAVATFFELGSLVRQNPDITRQIIAQGSEVESHTMYHRDFSRDSINTIASDVNESRVAFSEIGVEVRAVRTPYGISNSNVKNAVGLPIVLWTVDTLDWKSKNAEEIKAIVMRDVFDGAIILMHDIYDSSADAVGWIIDTLREQGYDFVTVSEMARMRNTEMQPGAVYGSFR